MTGTQNSSDEQQIAVVLVFDTSENNHRQEAVVLNDIGCEGKHNDEVALALDEYFEDAVVISYILLVGWKVSEEAVLGKSQITDKAEESGFPWRLKN